jgi:hemoglobin-like flavoprotein
VKEIGSESIGFDAFNAFFLAAPETFQMFDAFSKDPNWQSSHKYLHHCKVVVNLFGSLIVIIHRPRKFTSHVNFLGFQHDMRGIKGRHFELFGELFLNSLEKHLKEKWSPDLREAWHVLYVHVIELMLENMSS